MRRSFQCGSGKILFSVFLLFLLHFFIFIPSAIAYYQIDTSFGLPFGQSIEGLVTTDFELAYGWDQGLNNDYGYAMDVDSSGRIVVAGYASNTYFGQGFDFALACYHPDGTLDASFGTNGLVVTNFDYNHDVIQAVAFDESGNIVAGGYANVSGKQSFALARYTSSGSLDTNFGTNGLVITNIGSSFLNYGEDLVIDLSNRILLAG